MHKLRHTVDAADRLEDAPMTPQPDTTGLVAELRQHARQHSAAAKMMADAKTARQTDRDGYPEMTAMGLSGYDWIKPEQTAEWRAADLIERLSAPPPSTDELGVRLRGIGQAERKRLINRVWRVLARRFDLAIGGAYGMCGGDSEDTCANYGAAARESVDIVLEALLSERDTMLATISEARGVVEPFVEAHRDFEAECFFGCLGTKGSGTLYPDDTRFALVHAVDGVPRFNGGQTMGDAPEGEFGDIGSFTLANLRNAASWLKKMGEG